MKILIELYGGDAGKAKKIAEDICNNKKYDEGGRIREMVDRYTKAE